MLPTAFAPVVPLPFYSSTIPTVQTPLRTRCARRSPLRALVTVGPGPERTTVSAQGQFRFPSPAGTSFQERAEQLAASGAIPHQVVQTMLDWFPTYCKAVEDNRYIEDDPFTFSDSIFYTLLELIRRSIKEPIQFESYHKRIRSPFDYYKFSFEFASVLINSDDSQVHGIENLRTAVEQVQAGHNVIFLSNHQSEADPYAIDAMLAWLGGCDRQFCEKLIFMAGDRVRKDPLVSSFSAGMDLLTVYSKRHINDIPELREEKLLHNRRTIAATQKLFKAGGNVVWFAPAGGRDRRSATTSHVELSDFDSGAVDMMRVTANKSGHPCHFYPMSLWTCDMLPPPSKVGGDDVGEERIVNHIPTYMYIGEEIDWNNSPASGIQDRRERRRVQSEFVQQLVADGYRKIGGYER